MSIEIEKVPGGFRVDGLYLKTGKCGCTSVAKCCYSWSKAKKKGNNLLVFIAKMTTNDSSDHFNWSYTVIKDGVTVEVTVEDARDKDVTSAYIPPAVCEWEQKGWEVLEKEGEREDGIVWRCAMCKWMYKDKEEGIPFNELPDDWQCPICKVPKTSFEQIG